MSPPNLLHEHDLSDPKFVSALARGLGVLRAFRRSDTTLGNQALASRTGLPKATVSRLTYTLCKLGYLAQVETSGEYRLAAGAMTLGLSAVAATDLHDRAMMELEILCRSDNANVAAGLGERHDLSMIYLATYRKPRALALNFTLGGEVPLFATSIGRAAIMTQPEDRQDALLARARDRARPEWRDRLAGWLDKAREDYARYGFCTSFGDWREEIHGIAAPVTLPDKTRSLAINVGGLSFFNPAEELMRDHGDRLLQAAANLSLKLRDDDDS
ncbi:IclR family transcriptional regulator [Pseudooceanicola aestuarii]|uniref:IclR family transcriptional regulator n=1 Tax=Pseudooceanicola aestuarii TaxID=2697319 RepID=UPI0013CF7F7B|nr:IclR family transcriptional regulator [Pseudooceanicola aestuarii]